MPCIRAAEVPIRVDLKFKQLRRGESTHLIGLVTLLLTLLFTLSSLSFYLHG